MTNFKGQLHVGCVCSLATYSLRCLFEP